MSHQVRGHVNARRHDGQRRSTGKVTHGRDPVRKRGGHAGDLVWQVEQVAETVAKIAGFGGGGCGVGIIGVWNASVRHDRVDPFKVLVREELFQSLVDTPDLLPRHLGNREDLCERTGDFALAAGNEDTSRDDHVLRLSLEGFGIVHDLEQVLGCIGYILLNVEAVA